MDALQWLEKKLEIQKELPKALFFHCASHKLNLVINDLNEVSEIRNTIGVIKQTINFFRESVLRRKLVPNIPMLRESRWSAKYKSIRIFSEHYVATVEALEDLASMESSSNAGTRQRAHILHCGTTSSSFIVSLHIVAKYSARLEPVTNVLQSVSMNFHSVHNHITELQNIFRGHRTNAEEQFSDIMKTASEAANHLGVLISVPRQASQQAHRDNYGIQLPEEYYRVAIYVPYLDSLNASLARRFSESNMKSYRLLRLHPARMKHLSRVEFAVLADELQGFYGIENFKEEGISWYEMWLNRTEDCSEISYPELLLQAKTFFPAVANAIEVALALPVTTCTVERSFSTLRRVKTWLRSTKRNDRLDGLCMMSVHRERVMKHKDGFITRVITQFAQKSPRCLQLLFKED
ncbi:zinc finger MYM-type protein 1-like [Ixodes scapularis]|uniref:zinc finger MYM-type protein 1-like n=1 Tax=Ixodes scapularis TaxID=6945 RepID=UPI001A9FD271|nr:zinc finger MYM-type protein 1-like [Ixodes scapularis]